MKRKILWRVVGIVLIAGAVGLGIFWGLGGFQKRSIPSSTSDKEVTEEAARPHVEDTHGIGAASSTGQVQTRGRASVEGVGVIYAAATIAAALLPELAHVLGPAAAAVPSVLELAKALEEEYGPDLSAFDADLSSSGPRFISILERTVGTAFSTSQRSSVLSAVRGVTLRKSTGVRHNVFAGEIAGLLTGPGTDTGKAKAMEQHVKKTLKLSNEEFQVALEKGVIWETICAALERTAQEDSSYVRVLQAVEELRQKLGKPRCGAAPLFVNTGESIRAAIETAPEGTVIYISAGTWKENVVIKKSITLLGAGPEKTLIKGAERGKPVLQIHSTAEINVRISGLSIRNAQGGPRECLAVYPYASQTICPDGIAIQGRASVSLSDLVIADNGRMGVYATDYSRLTMDKCRVSGNGRIGVFVRRYASATIERIEVRGNHEGVMIADSARASLTDCTITESTSYGVYIGGPSVKCTLENCIVSHNGNNGIALGGNADVSLKRCQITENKRWGIVKLHYPLPFTGTLHLDKETVLKNNEFDGIGSM